MQVVYKLSKILRRLLRQQENLTALREELSFIDDYLAIEMIRFGEKLRVVKEIAPETLHIVVRLRKQDVNERKEQEAILEVYLQALGMI